MEIRSYKLRHNRRYAAGQSNLRFACLCARRYVSRVRPLILLLIALVHPITGHACMGDPSHMITQDPERYLEEANFVFLGTLSEFNDLTQEEQVVTFKIDKTFKGPELTEIAVVNGLLSSCSKPFYELGSRYYVFGNIPDGAGHILITRFATFVPEEMAKEEGMALEKTRNK